MATYPTLTLSFEDRITMHLQETEQELNSQAWGRDPILDVLEKNSKPYKGGEYISEPVEDNYTPTGSAIGEGSLTPMNQPNISTQAMYTPKFTYESIFLDGVRRDKIDTPGNMGPVLNWSQEVANNRAKAARENISLMVCAATTGTAADGSTNVQALCDIVKGSGTVGGLVSTNQAYWLSQADATSEAWSAGGVARTRTLLRKTRRYKGFSGPDVFFVSATTIDAMKASTYTKTTFFRESDARGAKTPDVGDGPWEWTGVAPYEPDTYFDNIPVFYDPHLDALESSSISTGGVLIGINTKAVYLRKKEGMLFKLEEWRKAEQRYGTFTRIMSCLELVACNRSCNLIRTNIL